MRSSIKKYAAGSDRRRYWLWGLAAGMLMLVGGLSLVRPASDRLADTILLRDLYAKAVASSLPTKEGLTLWEVDGQERGGPQQKLCTNYDGPAYGPSKDIYFRQDKVSAWYAKAGYPGALPIMRYSEHAEAPAFHGDVFKGAESDTVRTMLAGAVLTDRDGRPMAEDAGVEMKADGGYDVYAHITTSPDNYKGYVADCSQLMLHIRIDAKTGLYTEISVYKDVIAPKNLSFSQTQSVKASAVSFEQALPVLQTAGFDLQQAKGESRYYNYAQIVNKQAGYTFSYAPSVLGKPKLTELRAADGRVTEYVYTFSAQPQVRTSIRTADSVAGPRTIDDMRGLVQRRQWAITTDSQGDDSNVPGCKAGDKEWFLGANDTATEHNLFARTCGAFPTVYTEMPMALRTKFLDPYSGYPMESTPIAGFDSFAPGGEPHTMH